MKQQVARLEEQAKSADRLLHHREELRTQVDEYCLKLIVGHQIGYVSERVYTHRTLESLITEIEKIE